ncbi:mixed lineage kinase domain-like protein [Hyperolius riggenbachi]|uniref:mixed lineage kinase domain-like protein n=1 Tax=Hyperolius riggenbachi TaxID=752182 RepID=UPI0035A316A6
MEVAGEVLKSLFSISKAIYSQCDQAKTNKKLCIRLKQRITLLMIPVEKLQRQQDKCEELRPSLLSLQSNLVMAKNWAETYSKQDWLKSFFLAMSIYKKFEHINDQLSDNAEALLVLLQVDQRVTFLKALNKNCWKSAEEDFKQLLQSEAGRLSDKVDSLSDQMQQVLKLLTPQVLRPWDIKEIPAADLRREPSPLMTTEGHSLYVGEYFMDPVLIKVLRGQINMDNKFIRKTFESECKTMKKYESHNILRLYGICIDESGSEPCYSLVTEYCEKGTLRELLQREPDLSWERRVVMALDASRALHRIHHTEKKAILHGSLSSLKFLVNDSYCLKLSGFELSKTESSMRRNPIDRSEPSLEVAYMPPETLESINAYDTHSEIFSLGVVIFEIATGILPLKGLALTDGSSDSLYEKLIGEVKDGLKDTCPPVLCSIIHDCLQRDPQKRPTAQVIADRLIAAPQPKETSL